MKIIRSLTTEHIGQIDIDRIAMEMVNLYHGIQYYESHLGTRLEKPKHGYLKFTKKDIENTLIPSRGYICINANTAFGAWNINTKTLMRNIYNAFMAKNLWGYRHEEYKFWDKTDVQMTLTCVDNPTSSFVEITDKPWNVYKCTSASMLWYVSGDVTALTQFDIDYAYREPWMLTVPATTIVLDLIHEDHLPNGLFSLNAQPLPSNYKIMKEKLKVDEQSGAELHLWAKLAGKMEDTLRFTDLSVKCYAAPPLDKLELKDEKMRWSDCSVCNNPIWSKFYILADDKGKSRPVCRFCMHYATPEVKDGEICLVSESKLNALNVVNGIRDMTYDEREAVKFMITNGVKYIELPGYAAGYISGPYVSLSAMNSLTMKTPRAIAAIKVPTIYYLLA